jgi:hypothetical protein
MGTYGPTDGPTNGPTNAVSYRGATSRLKTFEHNAVLTLREKWVEALPEQGFRNKPYGTSLTEQAFRNKPPGTNLGNKSFGTNL